MSKSIGESLFEVLIMLNFTAKIHFFVRTAKFLTKKLSKIYLFYVSLQPNCNKQNFYSLISETSNEPIIQDITIGFAHSCMYLCIRMDRRRMIPNSTHWFAPLGKDWHAGTTLHASTPTRFPTSPLPVKVPSTEAATMIHGGSGTAILTSDTRRA